MEPLGRVAYGQRSHRVVEEDDVLVGAVGHAEAQFVGHAHAVAHEPLADVPSRMSERTAYGALSM